MSTSGNLDFKGRLREGGVNRLFRGVNRVFIGVNRLLIGVNIL